MAKFLCLFSVLTLLAVALALPSPKKYEMSVSDASSSQESSEESSEEEYRQRVRETCRANSGSDEAFRKLGEATQKAVVCVSSIVDMESLQTDAQSLSNETRTSFFPRYCPQLKAAQFCLNGVMIAAKPCLEYDDFVIVKALSGIIPDAIDLICKNDGEILFEMNEPKYQECAAKFVDTMEDCVILLATETDQLDISDLTQDQCGALSIFRQCVRYKLNVCQAPNLISVYDLFNNMLFRMTPCRNYANHSKVEMMYNNYIN